MAPRKPPPPPDTDCTNCGHARKHNLWGRCAESGCDCREPVFPAPPKPGRRTTKKQTAQTEQTAKVIVMRNQETGRPVAVPDEIVSAHDRVYRAYLLRRRGFSWDEIAHGEQWPTGQAVAAEVKRYLNEGDAVIGAFRRRELLAMEVDRLDTLQQAVWGAAMEGKVNAIMAARTLIMDRVKVMQLDQGDDAAGESMPTTVVVFGDSESDYIGSLRDIVEGGATTET